MRIIRNLLTKEELETLRSMAKATSHFKCGTYSCGTVKGFGSDRKVPDEIYKKFLDVSGVVLPFNGRDIQQFISYEQGGSNSAHKDWVYDTRFVSQMRDITPETRGVCELFRVNALVDAAAKGGELFVEGQEIKLAEGDAISFRPELQVHEVKKIEEGSRMIFTIGFHHYDTRTIPFGRILC